MNNITENIISGVIGGIIVLIIQMTVEFFKVKRKNANSKIIEPDLQLKTINTSILNYIKPGYSLSKAFDLLEIQISSSKKEYSEFQNKDYDTNSYLFKLNNAFIKVTSMDKETIDSITITQNYSFEKESDLAKGVIDDEILEYTKNHFSIRTSKDFFFGIETYRGNMSHYLNISYFGFDLDKIGKYEISNNVNDLKGAKYDTICYSRIEGFAPYIGLLEIRHLLK